MNFEVGETLGMITLLGIGNGSYLRWYSIIEIDTHRNLLTVQYQPCLDVNVSRAWSLPRVKEMIAEGQIIYAPTEQEKLFFDLKYQ